jgi:branched-chain amino acid transport system ATP-binding protein
VPERVLQVRDLRAGYGLGDVIQGIDLFLGRGELVVIIGPNGAGKSTFLGALYGLVPRASGEIVLGGERLERLSPDERLRRGLAFVPQGRCNFQTMSVDENLDVAVLRLPRSARSGALEKALRAFPSLSMLRRRPAGALSGGEQQVLEMAMALVGSPSVLLLDEPSLGLSPGNTKIVFDAVQELRTAGVAVLMVEQNARAALEGGDRAYVFDGGRSRLEDTCQSLLKDPRVRDVYLGGRLGGAAPQITYLGEGEE